jgi:hypothetical protein
MMANRISNRRALTQRNVALASPPQRAVIPPPIVYTPITTPFAQPPSESGGVSVWNGVTTVVGQEK